MPFCKLKVNRYSGTFISLRKWIFVSDMDLLHEKKKKLEELLGSFGSAAIAFSGGVDSTFLLCEARAVLMERAVAVTVRSESFPSREMREAEELCRSLKVRHHVLDFRQLEMEEFARNPRNR